MTARRGRFLGWALVVVLVLAGVAAAVRPEGDSRVAALVAAENLEVGTVLDGMAAGRLAPVEVAVPEGVGLILAPIELPAGARLISPLSAGEPLTWSSLGGLPGARPAPLAPGERAVALPASAFGSSALALVAGSRVDLAAVIDGQGASDLLVSDAEVMVATTGSDGDADGLLLRVPKEDALRVAGAIGYSREVRVIVRPVGERENLAPAAPTPPSSPPPVSLPPADLGDSARGEP